MASHEEELGKLRLKISQALNVGLFDKQHAEFFQETMLQIMNETERSRQGCVSQAQRLREQAAAEEAKSQAFGMQLSIINAVLAGYVRKHEQAMEESKRVAADQAEKLAAAAEMEKLQLAEGDPVAPSTQETINEVSSVIPEKRRKPIK